MTYDTLARFYDLENADFIEDLDFWVGLAKESGGPVLELGCGTARVTQQIARAGIPIIGLDNSEPMLAMAHTKLNRKAEVAARVTLVQSDMTDFDLTAQLPDYGAARLAIVPFNTFMHLQTTDDQLAMLTCTRRHLALGGRLALDLTNPSPAYAEPPTDSLTLERTFRDEDNDLIIEQFSTVQIDRLAQVAHIVYHYDTIAADGTLKRSLVPIDLRYTFPIEMGLLLERTGFRLAHLYGDYDETSLEAESERMIVVAEAV